MSTAFGDGVRTRTSETEEQVNPSAIPPMNKWLRLLLVLMTVGGGFTGITVAFNVVVGAKESGALASFVALNFLALYTFVAAAGLLFVYDSRRTRPMLVALALQIPWVSLSEFEYHFAAGLNAAVTFGPSRGAGQIGTTAEWIGHFETAFQFRFGEVQEGPWRVGINLFATLLFVLLWLSIWTSSKKATTNPSS